jgi:TM2 domain-containing membrane protein YozV
MLTITIGITILLAVLISGVDHIYLGIIKRGIIILIVGIALWIIVPLFVPFPLDWVISGA